MNIPGFDAQVSLYKSGQAYWGHGGGSNTAPRMVPALFCEAICELEYGACAVLCGLNPACLVLCDRALVRCLNGCLGGGGGGGGGAGGGAKGCCPIGKKCCGQCVRVPGKGVQCDDVCVGRNEQCP
jgi:hypothetical protein